MVHPDDAHGVMCWGHFILGSFLFSTNITYCRDVIGHREKKRKIEREITNNKNAIRKHTFNLLN